MMFCRAKDAEIFLNYKIYTPHKKCVFIIFWALRHQELKQTTEFENLEIQKKLTTLNEPNLERLNAKLNAPKTLEVGTFKP